MLQQIARWQDKPQGLSMPDQALNAPFADIAAPRLAKRPPPKFARLVLFGLPLVFAVLVGSLLVLSFRSDGQLTITEAVLVALMTLLAAWESLSTANALLGFTSKSQQPAPPQKRPLNVALLVTMRNEAVEGVLPSKLALLRALQGNRQHRFSLHVLSDSTSEACIEIEWQKVRAALPLPVFYHHRPVNIDFKSGNIRNWVEHHGAAFDAFIVLDADSEMDAATALVLAEGLSSDPACGLIQTVPTVLAGDTSWQRMQSIASKFYGRLQGKGLSAWMADEANYYGHNAIIRTRAFAASAGLPHLKGPGLWNGSILSHDFVEAALMRRAGWSVQLLPRAMGSYEQAPSDVIAHIKRDARWCLGNFQHSRVVSASGLHTVSRFHMVSGIMTYLSSVLWLATLCLWAQRDVTDAGAGGFTATGASLLIATNLLLPRVLGVLNVAVKQPAQAWHAARSAFTETIFSSLFAPSLMVQRVMIIGRILVSTRINWPPHDTADRSVTDYVLFHKVEWLLGLGLIACIERDWLSPWFLPVAACLALAPVLSWMSAWRFQGATQNNAKGKTVT